MLTSIPGIGLTLASGMAAELGDPSNLSKVDSLCAFAGIVPQTFQNGAPDHPAAQGHAPARCHHILKDWTLQSAQKIHLYGPPELKERISRWNANGQHGSSATAPVVDGASYQPARIRGRLCAPCVEPGIATAPPPPFVPCPCSKSFVPPI